MSSRLTIAVCFLLACSSSSMRVKKGEPQTAREKMLAEQKANPDNEEPLKTSKKWKRWRYQGDREDCFYRFGRRCFKTEKAACRAAGCKAPQKCEAEGAGPAVMTCKG